MVIRVGAGEVGPSVSQLVKDVRAMMEPGTASRLKERRSNKLRDYTTIAGSLGVSHLLLFSRSDSGNTSLRIAVTPRGPTLNFRLQSYALMKDVQKAQRHPQSGFKHFLMSPLLVMNGLNASTKPGGSAGSITKHLGELITQIFQSLFPTIKPQDTPLSSIRRVVLLNREVSDSESLEDVGTYVLDLRHYYIVTKPAKLSHGLRRLHTAEKLLKRSQNQQKFLPDLGKLEDVADYLLEPSGTVPGFTSASESEVETDAEVEMLPSEAKKVLTQRRIVQKRARDGDGADARTSDTEKRAIKLVEIGPRLKLRLTKVEEDLCGGKVMWHEYINKTQDELSTLEKTWVDRRNKKIDRRQVQKENVERKKKAAAINTVHQEEDDDFMSDSGLEISNNDADMNLAAVDTSPESNKIKNGKARIRR